MIGTPSAGIGHPVDRFGPGAPSHDFPRRRFEVPDGALGARCCLHSAHEVLVRPEPAQAVPRGVVPSLFDRLASVRVREPDGVRPLDPPEDRAPPLP